jgi:heat shock protein HspQ
MNMRVTPSEWSQPGANPGPAPDVASELGDDAEAVRVAKFGIGQVVKHRIYSFRGVIFDVDPVFANTEEWLASIPPDVRPHKDQPFYHLLAENDEGGYVAYVSEQNLLPDTSGEPVGNPNTALIFDGFRRGQYHLRPRITH